MAAAPAIRSAPVAGSTAIRQPVVSDETEILQCRLA